MRFKKRYRLIGEDIWYSDWSVDNWRKIVPVGEKQEAAFRELKQKLLWDSVPLDNRNLKVKVYEV